MTSGSACTWAGVPSASFLPKFERDDVVGDRHHQAHVMLDQQHRDVALVADAADQVAEHVDLFVVEAAGRLVEQQDLRSAASARASSTRFWVPNGRPDDDGVGDVLEVEIGEDLVRPSC